MNTFVGTLGGMMRKWMPVGVAAIAAMAMSGTGFAYLDPHPITLEADSQPSSIAVADFNHDNHLDIARTGYPQGYLLLGDGSGNFPTRVPIDATDFRIVAGDFDGDDTADLAGLDGVESLTYYFGDGSAGFTAVREVAPWAELCCYGSAGCRVCNMAVGDFNGDGIDDIANTYPDHDLASCSVGTGSRVAPSTGDWCNFSVQGSRSVVAVDFNHNGSVNWAFTGYYWPSNSISLLGFASGLLSLSPSPCSGISELASGDFDGDGTADLVAWCPPVVGWGIESTVTFMHGTDTGFVLGNSYPLIGFGGYHGDPGRIIAADINRDTHLDLVALRSLNASGISIVFGDGTGSFGAPLDLSAVKLPVDIAVADFNEDGFPDIAAASWGSWDDNGVLQGAGVTLFLSVTNTPIGQDVSLTPVDVTTGASPVTIRFSEVTQRSYTSLRTSSTGPGLPDGRPGVPLTYYWVATEPLHSGPTEVCISYSAISFADESQLMLVRRLPGGDWEAITTSLDTTTDVICGVTDGLGPDETPFIIIAPRSGPPAFGLFDTPSLTHLPGFSGGLSDHAVSDFDGDGSPDVIVTRCDSNVYLLLGDGTGALDPPIPFPTGNNVCNIVVGDFDGDGTLDDVAALDVWPYPGSVRVLVGDGHGSFGPPVSTTLPDCGAYGVPASGDFNQDGRPDLGLLCWDGFGSTSVQILFGEIGGEFASGGQYDLAASIVEDVTTGDFDNDGTVDLAATASWTNEVVVLLGGASGTFAEAPGSSCADPPYGLCSGDFSGDGVPDLVTVAGERPSADVYLGDGAGGFALSESLWQQDPWPWRVRAADVNGDGHLDVVSMGDRGATVHLGNDTRSFGPGWAAYPISGYANGLRVADINNDRAPDLLLLGVPSQDGEPTGVWVYLNISTNTHTGSTPPDYPVTPTDSTTGTTPVAIYFSNVTTGGFTGIATSAKGPPPPQGFKLGAPPTYYEITTTAAYSGLITICINYNGISYPNESTLEIWHGLPGGGWEKLPNPVRYPDEDRICADTASLSPFIVAYAEDAAPPTISLVAPQDGASYVFNAAVLAAYSCDDGQSGVQACSGTVASGAPLDTSSVGPRTFSVTATDGAGNTATVTATYRVVYEFTGFMQPVDNPPTLNLVNAGRTIPVKWRLADAAGTSQSSFGTFISLQSNTVDCDSSPPDTIPDSATSLSGESLQYDDVAGQFVYNWRTDKGWAGTCRQIWLTLADGTVHTAKFKFK